MGGCCRGCRVKNEFKRECTPLVEDAQKDEYQDVDQLKRSPSVGGETLFLPDALGIVGDHTLWEGYGGD